MHKSTFLLFLFLLVSALNCLLYQRYGIYSVTWCFFFFFIWSLASLFGKEEKSAFPLQFTTQAAENDELLLQVRSKKDQGTIGEIDIGLIFLSDGIESRKLIPEINKALSGSVWETQDKTPLRNLHQANTAERLSQYPINPIRIRQQSASLKRREQIL